MVQYGFLFSQAPWSLSSTIMAFVVLATIPLGGCAQGPIAYFDPIGGETITPFPSNFYTHEDGTSPTSLRLDFTQEEILLPFIEPHELNELDGFSTHPLMLVSFSGPIDPSSLPAGIEESMWDTSPLFVVNMDSNLANFGERIAVESYLDSYGLNPPVPVLNLQRHTLVVEPAFPLEPATRYGLVVTRGLKGTNGKEVRPSELFELMKGPSDPPPGLEALKDDLTELFQFLEDPPKYSPIPREEVVVASLFTTSSQDSQISDMLYLQEWIEEEAISNPPEVIFDPPWSYCHPSCPTGNYSVNHIGALITGRFTSHNFQLPGGDFMIDPETGLPTEVSTPELEFILTLPERAAQEPAPVLCFLHGINGCKDHLLYYSDMLAAEGIAVIGIDAVAHGSRATLPWPLGSLEFFRVDDISVIRDNFRQTVVDLIQLVEVVKTFNELDFIPLDPSGEKHGDGKPDLDVDTILFIGVSLGAFTGAPFLALELEVPGGVLCDGGGLMARIVREDLYGGLIYTTLQALGLDPLGMIEFIALSQHILDEADPLYYAPGLFDEPFIDGRRPANVLQIETMSDQIIPNSACEVYARAAALPLLEPYLKEVYGLDRQSTPVSGNIITPWGTSTAGLFQVEGEHGSYLGTSAGMEQTVTFLREIIETGQGLIINPFY